MTSKQNKYHFIITLGIGLIGAIVLGFLSGMLRSVWNSIIILWGSALAIAVLIQKTGKGVEISYGVLGAILVMVMMAVSDVTLSLGLSRIFEFQYYGRVLETIYNDNVTSIIWLLYRLLAVFIGYHYSKVV